MTDDQPEANATIRFGPKICACEPNMPSSVFATQALDGDGITEGMAETAIEMCENVFGMSATIDMDAVESGLCWHLAGVRHHEAPIHLQFDTEKTEEDEDKDV